MAVSSGTFTTTSAVGNRESLSNVLELIQRSDTPIYSMIGREKASSTFSEWETEAMDAPGNNVQSEGRDFAFSAIDPVERYGNYTQIMEKEGKASGTQQVVDNAGKAEKIERAKYLKGLALKTDVEFSIVTANASVSGTDRVSGSLSTWAETNVSRGATGVNGGYNSGTKLTVAPTNGTQRAFTKALLDNLLQTSYSSGAKLSQVFLSPYNKGVFATFMSDANVAAFRTQATKTKNAIVADAEMYVGPLGTVQVNANFVMSGSASVARNIFVLDTSKIKWAWLRKIHDVKDLANTGDHKKFVLQGEGCLMPKHEKAVGVIADVFGMTAST